MGLDVAEDASLEVEVAEESCNSGSHHVVAEGSSCARD